jgi:predicted  nucleic acid-binding Zn-ribbon protein
MTASNSPPVAPESSKPHGFNGVAGWLTTAALLIGMGYGAAYKLRIEPLESDKTNLRADVASLRSQLEKSDADIKTLNKSQTDALLASVRVQANVDGTMQTVGECKSELTKSQNLIGQYQRNYTMSSHLYALRNQQIELRNAAMEFGRAPDVKVALENDMANLQKQIKAATKCSG